jgi:DNA-binding MarR family transcriptional regulator
MDSTMMTRVIGLLHRRGWVVRQPGADRRQRIYAITPNGVRQLDAARPAWRRARQRTSALLGDDAMAALIDATMRIGTLE